MKIRKGMTIYKCEHCGKNYINKKWAAIHEHCCSKNPRNKSLCISCQNRDNNSYCLYFNKYLISRAEKYYGDIKAKEQVEFCMILKHDCSKYCEFEFLF